MRWYYCLGHLSFPKLKQLALNGEIPKKLPKIMPPKRAGCLFGAMTKLPWQGKETKASHKVFIATKPGECISVNQMMSTEVDLYSQLEGKLTKKRYKCTTVFVDHFSRLRFIHFPLDASSEKQWPSSLPLNNMPQSTGPRSFITTAITDVSMTMPSAEHATTQDRSSTCVG
jgi:hypothetical protein